MSDPYLFQYCQKIVVIDPTKNAVLLCQRKGEKDYDGVFSFIGGKMEHQDKTILEGLKREKDEEIGLEVRLRILPTFTTNVSFQKSDGNHMILPHYYAEYVEGVIQLSDEYSQYLWVDLEKVDEFEPKIKNIPEIIKLMQRIIKIASRDEFIEI